MPQALRAHIQRYIPVSNIEFEAIYQAMKREVYKKREILVRAGDPCEHFYFVLSGSLRTFTTDERGHEHNFHLAFEDWWASDLFSFITGDSAFFSIEALEDVDLLAIHRDDYEVLLSGYPKFERFFRLLMQNAYVASQKRTMDIMSLSAEKRYLELVKRYPQMELRVAQHHIASFLGITPEALSRIKRGLIEKRKTAQ
ncbi:MAG: Crp/Fnr family transcriptional regulator [Flavobacteriales bacterium]